MKTAIRTLLLVAATLMVASCSDNFMYSSITLSNYDVNLAVGETEQISTLVIGAKSKDPVLHWYSHDEDVATVSQTGLITAIGVGDTEVVVETTDGTGGKSVCLVTVH